MTPAVAPPASLPLTIEEYLARPDDGTLTELIRGRIVEVTRPGYDLGRIGFQFGLALGSFVIPRRLGRIVSNDSGIITERNPDTLRGADVAYYSQARKPPTGREPKYPSQPPDLVAEVRSPGDTWPELLAKAAEYLAAGVLVVVLLDPADESATVLTADAPPTHLGPADDLTLPTVLPEFRAPLATIFECD